MSAAGGGGAEPPLRLSIKQRAQPRVGVAAQHQLGRVLAVHPVERRPHGQVLRPGVRAQRRPPTLGVEVVEDLDVEQPDALRRPLRSIAQRVAHQRRQAGAVGRRRLAANGRRPGREVLDHVTVVAIVDRVGSAQLGTIPAEGADRHLVAPHGRQIDDDVERVERTGPGSRRVAPGHRLGDGVDPRLHRVHRQHAQRAEQGGELGDDGDRVGRRRAGGTRRRRVHAQQHHRPTRPFLATHHAVLAEHVAAEVVPEPAVGEEQRAGRCRAAARLGPHGTGQLGVDAQSQRGDAGKRRRGPDDLGEGEVVGAVAQPRRRTTRAGGAPPRRAASPRREVDRLAEHEVGRAERVLDGPIGERAERSGRSVGTEVAPVEQPLHDQPGRQEQAEADDQADEGDQHGRDAEGPQQRARRDTGGDRAADDADDPRPSEHATVDDRADELGRDRIEVARSELVEVAALGDEGVGDRPAGHRADLGDVSVQPAVDQRQQRADGEERRPVPATREGDGQVAGPRRIHSEMLAPPVVGST